MTTHKHSAFKKKTLEKATREWRSGSRYRSEVIFRLMGGLSIVIALTFLVLLLSGVIFKGFGAFWKTTITFPVQIPAQEQKVEHDYDQKFLEGLTQVLEIPSLAHTPLEKLPTSQLETARQLRELLSPLAGVMLHQSLREQGTSSTIQQVTIRTSDAVDAAIKEGILKKSFPKERIQQITSQQWTWLKTLERKGLLHSEFNKQFFTGNDSREPEYAGIWGALVGSFYTLTITLILSLILGVSTALYLCEFSPRNGFTSFIEVNVANLAAIPSIIFGLLAVSIFLNFLKMPRSSSLLGGITLSLIMMPTVVVATKAALKAVPKTIREAARGLGASRVQVAFHHVLPLAVPGILTGTILGLARALGESAPLLMIGMVAFIAQTPASLTDPATVLPVQIFIWARNPERGFVENTAAAIIVLLVVLVVMSLSAFFLRKKFERKW